MDQADRIFFLFSGSGPNDVLFPTEWSIIVFKICALLFVFAIALAGSFLPFRLRFLSEEKRLFITSASRCFAAGVFLGVGLLHMLPESDEGLRKSGWGKLPSGREFPTAFGVATLGFVVVWFLERHGEALWGPEKARMLAVAAQAEKCGGGSICYVQVETVASYGPVTCRPAHLPNGSSEPTGLAMPASASESEIEGSGPIVYARLPENAHESVPLSPATPGHNILAVGLENVDHQQVATEKTLQKSFFRDLFQHVPAIGQSLRAPKEQEADSSHPESECHLVMHPGHVHSTQGSDGGMEKDANGGQCHAHQTPELGTLHSHDWGPSAEVWGGSSTDECSALHQHTHSAQHHHIVFEGKGSMSVMLAALLSIHSFVVGVALGSSHSLDGAFTLLIALVAHKGAEAFSVGLQFVREDVTTKKAAGVLLLYCVMTPLGIVMGMATLLVQGPIGVLVADLVQAFGAGTVLYVVMHQLGELRESNEYNGLLEGVLLLIGVFLMFAVSIFS